MANESRDTEIILGTGRMLAIFFAFVLVCAVFFAIGFSLGRKTTMVGASSPLHGSSAMPAAIVRPSAGTDNKPALPATDFSFYKSVSSNRADTSLAPKDSQAQPPTSGTSEPAATAPAAASAAPAPGGYYVQVAAVSRQEDAESLVEALKKKQYPAFTASNSTVDKFYHVQVGPYADLKDAEGMRSRLIADGYNPIVKK